MTDLALWVQYLGGSEDAFASIVERHKNLVYGVCLRMLRDPGEAEDAAQATFLLLVRKSRSLPRQVVLSGWLYRSAVLVSRNAIKIRARRVRHEEKAARMRESRFLQADASWEEIRPQVDAALECLPSSQRDALILRYMQNRSVSEVARETGEHEAAISKRITRGLARLRELLMRKHLAVSSATLGAYLSSSASEAAPAALGTTIQHICLGKAAAGTTVTALTQSTLHGMLMAKLKVAALAVLAAVCVTSGAALASRIVWLPEQAYYIDFENGQDDRDGRSPATAFKHCPGDPSANGQAASVRLGAGDKVIFKGGVSYRGALSIDAQGTLEAPVVFDGNTKGDFGAGKAILDGAEPFGPWIRCASAAEALGHPNWQSLYTASVPGGFQSIFALNLCAGEQSLRIAQAPDLDDSLFYEVPERFLTLETAALQTEASETLLPIENAWFARGTDQAWAGAYVLYPADSFRMAYVPVKRGVPNRQALAVKSTTVSKLPALLRYSILNALPVLDRPGEYVVDPQADAEGRHKIWLWPTDASNLHTITRSARSTGATFKNAAHVVLDGFDIRRQGHGSQVHGIEGTARHTRIARCDIGQMRQWPRSGRRGAAVRLTDCEHVRLEDSVFHDNIGAAGVIVTRGSHITVSGNAFMRNGSTALDLYQCSETTVARNTISDHRAYFGNGITVAKECRRILIERNVVRGVKNSITLEDADTVTVRRNVLDDGINIWGGPLSGEIQLTHNVILSGGIRIGSNTNGSGSHHTEMKLLVANNILPGAVRNALGRTFTKAERACNLYFEPDAKPAVVLAEGEAIARGLAHIFADPADGRYRLSPGSPAVDAGMDLDKRNTFPDATPVLGRKPDIGVHEFDPREALQPKS
ncbi:MAG: sigma-70 family RNA polymerase sigma factor [Planctomycetes bacterium]|nr:sigma-70 family RNA polymerase sigma factor [Planctomycetota bacterium]